MADDTGTADTAPQDAPRARRSAGDMKPEPRARRGSVGTEALERLTLTIDEKGGIAFDRMQAATVEKLTKAVKATPDAGRALGLTLPAEGTDKTTSADVAVIYTAISGLMVMGVRRQGYSMEVAERVKLTAADVERLDAPTRKVLDKYNIFGRWSDEIGLAMILGFTLYERLGSLPPRTGPTPVIEMRPVPQGAPDLRPGPYPEAPARDTEPVK